MYLINQNLHAESKTYSVLKNFKNSKISRHRIYLVERFFLKVLRIAIHLNNPSRESSRATNLTFCLFLFILVLCFSLNFYFSLLFLFL